MPSISFDPSIPADGSVDVSGQLNTWLNQVCRGTPNDWAIVSLPLYGTLRCDSPVVLSSACRYFRLLGRGAQLLDGSPLGARSDTHLRFASCQDFEVRSLVVQGNADANAGYNASYEAQHAFELLSCQRGTLANCRSDNNWGDKVYIGMARGGQPSADLEIDSFVGGYSHRHGLCITGGTRIRTHDSDWGSVARSGWDFEPNTKGMGVGCIDFESRNDKWGPHHLGWGAAMGGGEVGNVRFINASCYDPIGNIGLVVDCSVDDGQARRYDFTFDGCSGMRGYGTGKGAVMRFTGVSGTVTVVNCRQPLQCRRPPPPMRMVRLDPTSTAQLVTANNWPADCG